MHLQHRGVEQLVARRAHNPEAGGSSPPPATIRGASVKKSSTCASFSKKASPNCRQNVARLSDPVGSTDVPPATPVARIAHSFVAALMRPSGLRPSNQGSPPGALRRAFARFHQSPGKSQAQASRSINLGAALDLQQAEYTTSGCGVQWHNYPAASWSAARRKPHIASCRTAVEITTGISVRFGLNRRPK